MRESDMLIRDLYYGGGGGGGNGTPPSADIAQFTAALQRKDAAVRECEFK